MTHNKYPLITIFILLLQLAIPVQAKERICSSKLTPAIEQILQRPQLRKAHWGILVQSQATQQTLYSRNSQQYFIPASNTKLFTSAAALLKLGDSWSISTPIYTTGDVPRLNTLRLVGQGDPTITYEKLEQMVKYLQTSGVTHIEHLIVDDGYFPFTVNASWEWEDSYFNYGVSPHPLILHQNAITLTLTPQNPGELVQLQWSDSSAAKQWMVINQGKTVIGSTNTIKLTRDFSTATLKISGELGVEVGNDTWKLAVPDPSNYFLSVLQQVLLAHNITVSSTSITHNRAVLGEKAITFMQSPPLAILLQDVNKESNNLFAEVLLELVGMDNLSTTLTTLGVNSTGYNLQDGAGLSRHNLVTPEAISQLLLLMSKTTQAEVYRNSLSIAGVDGTLTQRLVDSDLQGKFYGKTGTLSGISALSGYLYSSDYPPMVVSILVNNSDQTSSYLRQAIDEMLLLLAKVKAC